MFFCFTPISALGVAIILSMTTAASAFNVGRCLSGGCDVIWELNKRLDDGIRSKVGSLAEPVRDAFLEAMREAEATSRRMINDIDQKTTAHLLHVDTIIRDAQQRLDATIDKAAIRAEGLTDYATASIRKNLIKPTVDDFRALALDVQKKIDDTISEIDCKITNHQERIKELVTLFRIPSAESCYRTFWKSGTFISERIATYNVFKCRESKELRAVASVDDLISKYESLGQLARYYSCLTQQSSIAADVKIYGDAAATWRLAKCNGQC